VLYFLTFGGEMTRVSTLILLLALGLLLPALALPAQVPVPQKSAAPVTTAGSQQSSATPPPSTHPLEKADLEAFFDGLVPLQMERSDVAGATVLVMKDGAELLKKGYGYSTSRKNRPSIRTPACFVWPPSQNCSPGFPSCNYPSKAS
jgi:CubicO group peptidase (beta-lactamase class C family)